MAEINYIINKNTCISCGICQASCPSALAIEEGEEGLFIHQDACIKCGHCAALCPNDSITNNGEKLDELLPISLDPNQLHQLILAKRSVRKYQQKVIPETVLADIINVIEYSATASNNRSMQLSVLQGNEVSSSSNLLASKMLKQMKLLANPIVNLLLSAKVPRAYRKPTFVNKMIATMESTMKGEQDRLFFYAPVVMVLSYPKSQGMFGRTNCAIAATQAMLYANSLGIGSCMIGFAEMLAKNKEVAKSLKIPQKHSTGMVFTLGYTAEQYKRLPVRNSMLKVVD